MKLPWSKPINNFRLSKRGFSSQLSYRDYQPLESKNQELNKKNHITYFFVNFWRRLRVAEGHGGHVLQDGHLDRAVPAIEQGHQGPAVHRAVRDRASDRSSVDARSLSSLQHLKQRQPFGKSRAILRNILISKINQFNHSTSTPTMHPENVKRP